MQCCGLQEDGSALEINGGDAGKVGVKGDIVIDGGLSVGGELGGSPTLLIDVTIDIP